MVLVPQLDRAKRDGPNPSGSVDKDVDVGFSAFISLLRSLTCFIHTQGPQEALCCRGNQP